MTSVETTGVAPSGPRIWPLSVKAYHALGEMGLIPERTELLHGQVFHKMSKSPLHSGLVLRLLRLLLAVRPAGWHVRPEQPMTCVDSEPEPDLAVVLGKEQDFWHEHPRTAEFIIEVCVTTHKFDRSKLSAYAGAGVKEVWLVLGPEKQIEVHRRPAGEQFEEHALHGTGGMLSSTAVPGFSLELDKLFEE